jgi:CRP-like cAMP-binding protein
MHHIFTPEEIMELNVPQNHIKKRVIDQMWASLLKRVKTDLSVCDHSENDSASDEEHMLSVSAVYLGTLKEIKRQILAKVFRKLPNHRFRIDGQNYEYLRGQYFYEIAILKRGSTFGELALLSSDNLRSATVFCETNC